MTTLNMTSNYRFPTEFKITCWRSAPPGSAFRPPLCYLWLSEALSSSASPMKSTNPGTWWQTSPSNRMSVRPAEGQCINNTSTCPCSSDHCMMWNLFWSSFSWTFKASFDTCCFIGIPLFFSRSWQRKKQTYKCKEPTNSRLLFSAPYCFLINALIMV